MKIYSAGAAAIVALTLLGTPASAGTVSGFAFNGASSNVQLAHYDGGYRHSYHRYFRGPRWNWWNRRHAHRYGWNRGRGYDRGYRGNRYGDGRYDNRGGWRR